MPSEDYRYAFKYLAGCGRILYTCFLVISPTVVCTKKKTVVVHMAPGPDSTPRTPFPSWERPCVVLGVVGLHCIFPDTFAVST